MDNLEITTTYDNLDWTDLSAVNNLFDLYLEDRDRICSLAWVGTPDGVSNDDVFKAHNILAEYKVRIRNLMAANGTV